MSKELDLNNECPKPQKPEPNRFVLNSPRERRKKNNLHVGWHTGAEINRLWNIKRVKKESAAYDARNSGSMFPCYLGIVSIVVPFFGFTYSRFRIL